MTRKAEVRGKGETNFLSSIYLFFRTFIFGIVVVAPLDYPHGGLPSASSVLMLLLRIPQATITTTVLAVV